LKQAITYTLEHTSKLEAGISIGTPTAAQMSFPSFGAQSIAFRITVPITAKGLNVNVYLDAVAVRKGRAYTLLTFQRSSTPVSSSMEESLTALTVRRLGASSQTS
jgi:hypothetical protein